MWKRGVNVWIKNFIGERISETAFKRKMYLNIR